jgi:hypothetical protein
VVSLPLLAEGVGDVDDLARLAEPLEASEKAA